MEVSSSSAGFIEAPEDDAPVSPSHPSFNRCTQSRLNSHTSCAANSCFPVCVSAVPDVECANTRCYSAIE